MKLPLRSLGKTFQGHSERQRFNGLRSLIREEGETLRNRLELSTLTFILILGMISLPSVSQQPLPDLVISKIWVGDKNNTPISPRAGEAFYVCATVKNLGNAFAEGYYVQPYFAGSPLAAGGPGRLEPGGAQDWSSGPIVIGPGIYEIRWALNPDRKIAEANYGNNEISMIIVVESSSSFETVLQPVGGIVGLAVLMLGVLAAGMVTRKLVQKKRGTHSETGTSKTMNRRS